MPSRFEVFTPGDFPKHNYVIRKFFDPISSTSRNPEDDIQEALKRPGMIVQVSGPSKSGKTVAVQQMIHESRLVRIHGSSIHSEDELWRAVAGELQLRVERKAATKVSHVSGRQAGVEGGIEIGPLSVGGSVGADSTVERETSHEHSIHDSLFKAAIDELTREALFLFIDDFHTVPDHLKRFVAAQLKAVVEKKVKVILAEVTHRADEPIESLQDLAGRIERIEFGAWSPEDLMSIGRKGFEKLNLSVKEGTLAALADEACGSPQLMQRLCLNLCQELGVNETLPTLTSAGANLGQLRAVFASAMRSVNYSGSIYALETLPVDALHRSVSFVACQGYDISPNEVALASLALNPPRPFIAFHAGQDTLTGRAARLVKPGTTTPSRELLASVFTRMSDTSQQPAFKAPALHFKPQSGVTVLDSLFLYSLRWSGRYHDLRRSIDTSGAQNSGANPG
jgi:hypothetical protein